MKKEMQASILTWLILMILSYLLISFTSWDVNPRDWNGFARFLYAILTLFITIHIIRVHED